MSDTYCRDDCRAWSYMTIACVNVEGEFWCRLDDRGHPIRGLHQGEAFCGYCGTALLPDGKTEEMVRRSVALLAMGQAVGACRYCPVERERGEFFRPERNRLRLAWAEQATAKKEPGE